MISKLIFDYIFALILLILLVGLIICLIIISSIETKEFGLFIQDRVGKDGKIFKIYKIRTMRGVQSNSILTSSNQITKFGAFFRKYKLDELPQLINILKGEMSFVGPRPDVIGYADELLNDDRIILKVKPGITGPAQLKYRNEESLLLLEKNPIWFNDNILWPDKVIINKEYVRNWNFFSDMKYIFQTVFN